MTGLFTRAAVSITALAVLLPVQFAAGSAKPRSLASAKSSVTASPVRTPAGKAEEAVTSPLYGASRQRPKNQASSQLRREECRLRWHQQSLVGGSPNLIDSSRSNQHSNRRRLCSDTLDDVVYAVLVTDVNVVIAQGVFEQCPIEGTNPLEGLRLGGQPHTTSIAPDEAANITDQTLFVDSGLTFYPSFDTTWSSE